MGWQKSSLEGLLPSPLPAIMLKKGLAVMMQQIGFNETTLNEIQNNAVSVLKLQICNHSIYNKKLKVKFLLRDLNQ